MIRHRITYSRIPGQVRIFLHGKDENDVTSRFPSSPCNLTEAERTSLREWLGPERSMAEKSVAPEVKS